MSFIQHRRAENLLVKEFDSIITSLSPIQIALNNFGQYPSHTIYIKVEDYPKLSRISRAIKSRFDTFDNEVKPFKPYYLSDPHVTIARGMSPTQFDRAWADWQKREFKANFIANEILILRKQYINESLKGNEYQLVKRFELTGRPKKDAQLVFFE